MITEKEVAPQQVTIDGLQFDLTVAKFIGKNKTFKAGKISEEPLINIYKKSADNPSTFVVNIFTYIPENLNALAPVENSIALDENIYFQYNGVTLKETQIVTENDNQASCRNFQIVFDGPENQPTFKLLQIQLEYTVLEGTEPVEAIIVRDNNLDPVLDRGTVTTPLNP